MYGTVAFAKSAARTLIIIDYRQIIRNGDRLFGTIQFALLATDTSVLAILSCNSALFGIAAKHSDLTVTRDQGDDPLRASFDTQTAADTGTAVYVRNIILHADRVCGANVGTVATAETAEAASHGTAVQSSCRTAGINALIDRLAGRRLTGTVAMHESNADLLDLTLLHGNAEDRGDLLYRFQGTGDTKIGFYLAFGKCLCVAVTARKAAGAAVYTRQACTDLGKLFVYLDCKEMCRKHEQDRGNETESGNDRKGDKNTFYHNHIPLI